MKFNLDGKVAFITASSRGIGFATARLLLSCGAQVVINGRDKSKLELAVNELRAEWPSQINAFQGDMAVLESQKQALKFIEEKYSKVDLLVANLGSGKAESKERIGATEFRRMLELNLMSTVSLLECFLPAMRRHKSGEIVLISSIAGTERSTAPLGYSAAKSGVIALAKNLAAELAVDGIRINAVAPGHILFPGGRWEEILKENPSKGVSIERDVPLGRFGRAEEVAAAVVFLASSFSSYITGSCLVVDGGLSRSF